MKKIVMMSKADMVKGQGVLSAHDEQVALVEEYLGEYQVVENRGTGDITHFHTINPGYLFRIPFAKIKGSCVGYVHFLPQTLENSLRMPQWMKKIFYKYVIHFYKKMDYLVTVNPYFVDVLQEYGVPRDKICYIPNVVSEEQFHPLPEKYKPLLRRKYHIKEGFTVLCVGQLQKRKGFLEFLETAERLPHIQFVWAGIFAFGKLSDGYDEIKERIRHLPKNVTLLGYVDRRRMNEVYNMADLLFLPSFEELFPMTVLESMSVGLPVLLRELPIYKAILGNYCLFGEGQEELGQMVAKLAEDPAYYAEGCQRSVDGSSYYSREHVAAMWREFYDAVIREQELRRGCFSYFRRKAARNLQKAV